MTTVAPATTTTTISTAAASAAYIAAVRPVRTALTSFGSKADTWTDSTSNAQAEADARPAVAALQKLDTTLTNDQWPASATADVHTMIEDLGALAGDLQGLSSINLLDASTWQATFQRDISSVDTASALVQHDLGIDTSAVGSCDADAKTVEIALEAYNSQTGHYPTGRTEHAAEAALIPDYLKTWPSNPNHYVISLSGTTSGGVFTADGGVLVSANGGAPTSYGAGNGTICANVS